MNTDPKCLPISMVKGLLFKKIMNDILIIYSFDIANYISRTTQPQSGAPSRTASTSSMSWASAPIKLPKIASGFFQQATRMNWLDDKSLFNWGRAEDSDIAEDVSFFMERFYGSISGRSRSGSVSESDSRTISRNRSRANSISSSSMDGFKVEAMTSLPNNIPPSIVVDETESLIKLDHKPLIAKNISTRRIFRIDDVDEEEEEEDEEELNHLAVAQGIAAAQQESRKDI